MFIYESGVQAVTTCRIKGDMIQPVVVDNLVSWCAKILACLYWRVVMRCWRDAIVLPSIFLGAVQNYQLYYLIAHITAHRLYSVNSTCLSDSSTYHVGVAANESTLCHLSPRRSYKSFSLSTWQSNKFR